MHGQVADMWHAANKEGKLELLKRAMETNCPLDIELLDEEAVVLDALAQSVGLLPVYVATVDGCGLSCQTPGVASPEIVSQYLPRKLRA